MVGLLLGASRELDGVVVTGEGNLDIAADGKDTVGRRHLQHQLGVVGDRHELGKHRATEYGMVAGLEVSDFECEELRAVVFWSTEGDWEHHPPDRV